MGELYQLPGRRRARKRIGYLTVAGVLMAAALGSWAGTQRLAFLGLRIDSGPIWDPAIGWWLPVGLVLVWVGGVSRGLWRRPIWWGWLVMAGLTWGASLGPLYQPYGILRAWWWMEEGLIDVAHFERVKAAITPGLVVFGVIVVWVLACAAAARRRVPRYGATHGSAHFATVGEIRAAGFFPRQPGGVVLGSFDGHLLRSLRDEHVLVYAPPGAGKSTSLVVPTALHWAGSLLVLDTKSEIFSLTSGYRSKVLGQDVCRLDLTDDGPGLVRFNPLFTIPRGLGEIKAAQGLVSVMIPAPDKGDPFWVNTAREFLVGLVLHVLYTEREPTLTRCRERLLEGSVSRLLAEMVLTEHSDGRPHQEIANSARALLEQPDKTRGGVLSTVRESLSLFADPYLQRNTSTSDVVIGDLLDRDRPVSMYVTLPAGDVDRLERILRTLVSQWLREMLLREVGDSSFHHRLLLLLDEFPVLGRMDYLVKAGALLRGYGVQLYIVVQSVTQLRSIYGQSETLSGLCSVQIMLGTTDGRTAKDVSERLGKVTIDTERESVSSSKLTVSRGGHARPLLGADEVAGLSSDLSIVLPAGACPILGDRIPYFKDRSLAQAVKCGEVEELARFEHDWSEWTESAARRPSEDEVAEFLAMWE